MFETLAPQVPDSLLGVMAAFAADGDASKVDLGVGVYRDASGITPVMAAVRAAELRVLARQLSKVYVGAGGNRPFAACAEELVLGAQHPARTAGRVATLQTPGGCGALRLAAELVQRASPGAQVALSDPSWANHVPLTSGAGLTVVSYPYYDAARARVLIEPMLAALERLPAGSIVLLQASCHNPTGADLAADEWQAVAAVLERRGLVPLLDIAYQGLGDGLEADVAQVRALAARLPELLLAVSCSKNFGLYRERVGAVMLVAASATAATVGMSHLQSLARRIWSMPPDHGAAIVAEIAGVAELRADWARELEAMRVRIAALRRELAAALRATSQHAGASGRFDFIAGQRGMFSLLGLPPAAVTTLRTDHHVYLAPDSRINVAGLPAAAIERVARAIRAVAG
jgi:aspartate/tyrosine/aromatic aminotransferase